MTNMRNELPRPRATHTFEEGVGWQRLTLIGLHAKVEPGSFIPVTFIFERDGRLSADIRVENLGEPEHKDHI